MEMIRQCVKGESFAIVKRARENSQTILAACQKYSTEFTARIGLDDSQICFAVVGSVGRCEALESSDIDVIPVAADADALALYMPHDKSYREYLATKMKLKVSKGEDLTKPTHLGALTEKDTIGGTKDTSAALTKRVLLATESASGGGSFDLANVRSAIVDAYADENRTSGRHTLSFCNDVARYYKTLCVEYKAKIDEEDKDWCTRNIKLRHSRKIWYFSIMSSVVRLADKHPIGDASFRDELLESLACCPLDRLCQALHEQQPIGLGKLIESYAFFLDFMATKKNREDLSEIKHSARYKNPGRNAFPALKFNSDIIHSEIICMIESMGPAMRGRLMSWFML